jgi:hypothetical protein
MPRPTNNQELRDQLLDAFESVKQDPRRANQVKEMVNAAGKVFTSLALELEYSQLRGERPEIPFLGTTSGIPLKSVRQLAASKPD